jgi:hypothetical protein
MHVEEKRVHALENKTGHDTLPGFGEHNLEWRILMVLQHAAYVLG